MMRASLFLFMNVNLDVNENMNVNLDVNEIDRVFRLLRSKH